MQMLAEGILSPLSVKQDRRIAGLTPISNSPSLRHNAFPGYIVRLALAGGFHYTFLGRWICQREDAYV
jgi:hypothetical protein